MADSVTTNTEQSRLTGRVKWFNNQAGYGFLTATVDGSEQDIFVHHSALTTGADQFRYLVEGEYVSFVTTTSDEGKTTATDVTGACGGKLMCETRWERKQASNARRSDSDAHLVMAMSVVAVAVVIANAFAEEVLVKEIV